MKTPFTTGISVFFMFCMSIGFGANAFANIYYVSHAAIGTGDGSSWTNAMTQLQSAIDVAADTDTICVAAGTYFPTVKRNGDLDKHLTFYIARDVVIMGGFSGQAGTEGDFEERDPAVHVTILSGDIGVQGDTADNVFHVVYLDHVSDTMRLNGFTIAFAHGFTGSGIDNTGGGIFINGEAGRCSPLIEHCIIRDNTVFESGAGVAVQGGLGGIIKPRFISCQFLNNTASGGGAYFSYLDTEARDNTVFVSCIFKGNVARTAQGSGISTVAHSSTSAMLLINCVLSGNAGANAAVINLFTTGTGSVEPTLINCTIAGNAVGSIQVSDLATSSSKVTVRNSIFWNNPVFHGISAPGLSIDAANCIAGGFLDGVDINASDPQFVINPIADNAPHLAGDVHLQSQSPAVDAGLNTSVPSAILFDADDKPRFINPGNGQPGIVDIGAYELQEFPVGTNTVFATNALQVFPNPVQDVLYITLADEIETGSISLMTNQGIVVRQLAVVPSQRAFQMEVSEMQPGVYFLSWVSEKKYAVIPVYIVP